MLRTYIPFDIAHPYSLNPSLYIKIKEEEPKPLPLNP
jgi:DNA-directed RNA polymerase subunit L